ncbi:hypothetical protein F5Y01DRAFT_327635 [Xylaria sp. FL0043]|nr:hypothetical protein F5Y01DRAFT_327635 [Xylaria sp. FL0043]
MLNSTNFAINAITDFAERVDYTRLRHEIHQITNPPLSLIHDPPWNPLSSSTISETRNQVVSAIQSIAPHEQPTFTASINIHQLESNNQDSSSKHGDSSGTEQKLAPDLLLNDHRPPPDQAAHDTSEIPQNIASRSRVDTFAAQQVDDPHRRHLVGNSDITTYEQELSVSSKYNALSGNSSSSESVDSETLSNQSAEGTGTGAIQNPGIPDVEGGLEHLGALLRRLDIQPGTVHHKIVLNTYEGIRGRVSHGTDARETQGSPVTSTSATSGTSGNASRPTPRPNKRSHHQCDDSDSEQHRLKKGKPPYTDHEYDGSHFLCCLFYKLNPYIYSTCASFKATSISKLGAHLKNHHTGDFHCRNCCRLFKTERQRTAHRAKCRPTRGPCVCGILPLPRTQGIDAVERWYDLWDDLFPGLRKPRDPWWSEEILREQLDLASMKRLWEAGGNGENNLTMSDMIRVLSGWETTLPDHLPDLQEFRSKISGSVGNWDQGRPHQVPGSSAQADYTPNFTKDAGYSNQCEAQGSGTEPAEREPSPPNEDPRSNKLDSDQVDSSTQLGPSGILNLPRSYDIPLEDIDSYTAPGNELSQMFGHHLPTDDAMVPFPFGDYTYADVGEMNTSNLGPDFWENGVHNLSLEGIERGNWEAAEQGASFFNQSWVDSEEGFAPSWTLDTE